MKTTKHIIYFYFPHQEQVDTFANADPDQDWRLFNTGVQVWIGQTYLRLRQLGMNVRLTSSAPRSGMVVTHADYVADLLAGQRWPADLVVVAARADRPSNPYAEFEIVQNGCGADGQRVHAVSHWPQPGLLKRDPARGATLRTVAYKGMIGEMGESFKAQPWYDFLQASGLSWQCDATLWQGNEQPTYQELAWNDYSGVDLIVAIRKNTSSLYTKKPASKLINAWAAGVPAILGPEYAYRELRRSPLDYIEASSAEEVAAAIDQLRRDPQLYQAMIDNGLRRAAEVDATRCAERWRDILETRIPARSGGMAARLRRLVNLGLRLRLARLRHRPA